MEALRPIRRPDTRVPNACPPPSSNDLGLRRFDQPQLQHRREPRIRVVDVEVPDLGKTPQAVTESVGVDEESVDAVPTSPNASSHARKVSTNVE